MLVRVFPKRTTLTLEQEIEVLQAVRAGWLKANKSKPGGDDNEKAKRAAKDMPARMRSHFIAGYLKSRAIKAKQAARKIAA